MQLTWRSDGLVRPLVQQGPLLVWGPRCDAKEGSRIKSRMDSLRESGSELWASYLPGDLAASAITVKLAIFFLKRHFNKGKQADGSVSKNAWCQPEDLSSLLRTQGSKGRYEHGEILCLHLRFVKCDYKPWYAFESKFIRIGRGSDLK